MRIALLAVSTIALVACGQAADPTATASTEVERESVSGPAEAVAETAGIPSGAPLHERFDCLRATDATLVIAHRGGPTRDYPENAIETLERTFKAGTRAMEVDITTSKDGQLVLMHDDELDRTTTGAGLVADHTLAEIQALNLRTGSKTTDFHAPTLEAALEWAIATGALLELDKKRSTEFAPVIAAVRAAKAENNVLLITYTDAQAAEVHAAAPELMISATVDSIERLDRLVAAGVKPERLLAWTGNVAPNPELWAALAARGVESIFGTNGSRQDGLDYRYWEDDDGTEFNALADNSLPILVTGYSDKVSRQLRASVDKARGCNL